MSSYIKNNSSLSLVSKEPSYSPPRKVVNLSPTRSLKAAQKDPRISENYASQKQRIQITTDWKDKSM